MVGGWSRYELASIKREDASRLFIAEVQQITSASSIYAITIRDFWGSPRGIRCQTASDSPVSHDKSHRVPCRRTRSASHNDERKFLLHHSDNERKHLILRCINRLFGAIQVYLLHPLLLDQRRGGWWILILAYPCARFYLRPPSRLPYYERYLAALYSGFRARYNRIQNDREVEGDEGKMFWRWKGDLGDWANVWMDSPPMPQSVLHNLMLRHVMDG